MTTAITTLKESFHLSAPQDKILHISKLEPADYSTIRATANKTPSSTHRLVAAINAVFHFAVEFLVSLLRSIAKLGIGAANFVHERVFTKEAPAAKFIEVKLEPNKKILLLPCVNKQAEETVKEPEVEAVLKNSIEKA